MGRILEPAAWAHFWRLNRPFVRRFGFNFGDVRDFKFFLTNHRSSLAVFEISGNSKIVGDDL